jgi:hypothetical protein
MKKLISIVAFMVAGFFLNELMAQGAEDDIQIIQGAWGKQKRDLVRIAMELSAKDSVKFWPVYDKYEVARKKIGRDRLMILNEYVASYDRLTNAKADTLVNRLFKNDAANSQLLQQYYNNMKKALNALQAAKFLHVESFLQSYIKTHLQANLPFIGDLEHTKTN